MYPHGVPCLEGDTFLLLSGHPACLGTSGQKSKAGMSLAIKHWTRFVSFLFSEAKHIEIHPCEDGHSDRNGEVSVRLWGRCSPLARLFSVLVLTDRGSARASVRGLEKVSVLQTQCVITEVIFVA